MSVHGLKEHPRIGLLMLVSVLLAVCGGRPMCAAPQAPGPSFASSSPSPCGVCG
jgi:hypothetical protein